MSKMIQLRNVPDSLHRRVKARAAIAGMSLSDYLLAEIKEIVERPTLAELRERLHRRKPVSAPFDSARFVREEREIPSLPPPPHEKQIHLKHILVIGQTKGFEHDTASDLAW